MIHLMQKLRFGILSTANIGRQNWKAIFNSGNAVVAAVASRDAGRSREFIRKLQAEFPFDAEPAALGSYEELLASPDVDAVYIPLPTGLRKEWVLRAAAAGKHVVCEKPLSMTPTSARAIAASVERQNLASIVFFMRRFIPDVESAIQRARHEPWKESNVRVHSGALVGDSPYARSVWRQADAGALWDIGPHVFSILIPVLGDVESLEATLGADKYVRFSTRHASGATAAVSLTLHADPSAITSQYVFRGSQRELTLPEPSFSRPALLAQAVTDLVGGVRSGKTAHRCDVRLGVQVVDALTAAARSLETGTPVDVQVMGR